MSPACPTCGLVLAGDSCRTCERRAREHAAWRASVAAPKCGCGKPLLRCDECAAMHCTAPGHLRHVCEVSHVE